MMGTNVCPDCIEALKILDEKKIQYTYLEFSESTDNLKKFLKYRDTEDIFANARAEGNIGVPCFELSDGTLTLSLEEVLEKIQGGNE